MFPNYILLSFPWNDKIYLEFTRLLRIRSKIKNVRVWVWSVGWRINPRVSLSKGKVPPIVRNNTRVKIREMYRSEDFWNRGKKSDFWKCPGMSSDKCDYYARVSGPETTSEIKVFLSNAWVSHRWAMLTSRINITTQDVHSTLLVGFRLLSQEFNYC